MQVETLQKEVKQLKCYAICSSLFFMLLLFSAFSKVQKQKFEEIDVERINIVEKDGTIKMLITNQDRFPAGKELVNNRSTNETRPKRPGILFFNAEGIECGGLIYDGKKNNQGHEGGMSLTFDQYDGDQVMQILSTDTKVGDKRFKSTGLIFNDRHDTLTQSGMSQLMKELAAIKDPQEKAKRQKELAAAGIFGAPRIYLGRTGSENNGLYLFDNKGKPRVMLYVDKENKAKLEFYDDKGKVVETWPKQ